MDTLKRKNILVTGATSGIGKCLTKKLLVAGAHVAFCGRSKDKMKELLLELNAANNCYHEVFDITNEAAIIGFVNNAKKTLGNFDVLVNCAGANPVKALVADMKTCDLDYMLKVNTIAPFIFMREVYKCMQTNSLGLFINVLSTVCNFSNEGIGAYTASKAGFDALVKIFRKEVRDQEIRVCSIYPGGVDTAFRENARPDYLNADDVAEAIISMMLFDEKTSIDELVIRPIIEKNYL